MINSMKSEGKTDVLGCPGGTIKIPLAFHFDVGLVSAEQEGCMVTEARTFVEELNRELCGRDQDAPLFTQFTSCFGDVLGNACIEFLLADQNHPSGYGLSDGQEAVTFGVLDFTISGFDNTPRDTNWKNYLNVFVMDFEALGVSNGIPGDFSGDGVAIHPCTFGTGASFCEETQMSESPLCSPTYDLFDQGETLVHEVGHYLGLFHIWGPIVPSCDFDDGIADTPNMDLTYNGFNSCSQHFSCSDIPVKCGTPDMYMNFMSYASDHCYYMLTKGQAMVMNTTAKNLGFTSEYPDSYYLDPCSHSGDVTVIDPQTSTDTTIQTNATITATTILNSMVTVTYRAGTGVILSQGFSIMADGSNLLLEAVSCDEDP